MNWVNRKMKKSEINQKRYKGFTLVELLVVVVIIAVLMGMLIPAVMRSKVRARIATARADMSNIKGAILSYQTDYSRFPVPRPRMDPATGLPTVLLPNWALQDGVPPRVGGGDMTFGGAVKPGYNRPNYGVMRILCSVNDLPPPTSTPPALPLPVTLTVNGNFSRNPKKNKYLDVPSGDNIGDPGLDPIYNFNDPWRQQYIITMDMDGDGDCSDRYYRKDAIYSSVSGPGTVKIGLRQSQWESQTGAIEPEYVLKGSVMVYSKGPDQKANDTVSALEGVNEDNILDWR